MTCVVDDTLSAKTHQAIFAKVPYFFVQMLIASVSQCLEMVVFFYYKPLYLQRLFILLNILLLNRLIVVD